MGTAHCLEAGLLGPPVWGRISVLPFPSYEILGKPLNFSKAQFPLTWAENSNFINLVGL